MVFMKNNFLPPNAEFSEYQRFHLISEFTIIDCLFEIRTIAVCFLWLSLPGDYRVTDEALLAETT